MTKTGMTTSRLNMVSVFFVAVVEISKMLGFSNEKTQHEDILEHDKYC